MSLAGDILRRAAVSPEQYQPSPVTVKPKPSVTPISNRNLHMARVPGCQRVANGWEVPPGMERNRTTLALTKTYCAHASPGDCGTCGENAKHKTISRLRAVFYCGDKS